MCRLQSGPSRSDVAWPEARWMALKNEGEVAEVVAEQDC